MRAPPLPIAAPSYAELFSEGCFAQRSLISGRELRDAAVRRGLHLPPFPRRDRLERSTSLDAFCPIGFLQTNYSPETTWARPDPELMVWREERHFEPWDKHGWFLQDEEYVNVSERYSPWQLLYLRKVLDVWGQPLSLGAVQPPHTLRRGLYGERGSLAASGLRALDEAWRPAVALLVASEVPM